MTHTGADRKRPPGRQLLSRRALDLLGALLIAAGSARADTTPPADTPLPSNVTPLPAIAQADKPATRDSLFADDPADKPQTKSGWGGFIQGEAARAYRDPDHWSKLRMRADVTRTGQFSDSVKWRIGGRFDYDYAYDQLNFYAPEVRQDQRYEFAFRENYLDISPGGNWEIRLGRQHVVWGDMVGLFIADAVSARDLREFILPEPDLQALRTPQWAARAEYFGKDVKAELLWVVVPSFDEIGKPGVPGVKGVAGADFYPYPIPGPGGSQILGEDRPSRKLSNTNYGARVSTLQGGWDMSAFYYHSLDITPTFYRQVLAAPVPGMLTQPGFIPGAPVFLYQARHDKIDQVGGTVSKDFEAFVMKAEAVYTDGRQFNVTRLTQPNGLVMQDTVDYAIGLDFSLPKNARLNFQFFQRIFLQHDADTLLDKHESGVSVLFDSLKFAPNVEGRLLLVHNLNRSDWLVRPKVSWSFEKNWRLAVGADIFGGSPIGVFGRYDNNDRVYTELRYTF